MDSFICYQHINDKSSMVLLVDLYFFTSQALVDSDTVSSPEFAMYRSYVPYILSVSSAILAKTNVTVINTDPSIQVYWHLL